MDNLRQLQEEARTLERAGRDAAAIDLHGRILSDPEGARLGGVWAARARLRLRAGVQAEAAGDLAASAERFAAAGRRNLALSQWRAALRADPTGPAEWRLEYSRLAAEMGYRRDARLAYAEYADRAERAGDVDAAVAALREYLAAAPDDAAVRRHLSELTGEPEDAPPPPPPPAPAPPAPEEDVHPAEDPAPLPGLIPTAADGAVNEPASDPGDLPPMGLLEGFEATHAGDAEVDDGGLEAEAPSLITGADDRAVEEDDFDDDDGEAVEPLPLLALDEDPVPAGEPPTALEASSRPPDSAPEGGDYVDFGAMVLADAPDDGTRFQVDIGDPSGDEEGDFAEILDLFRRNVSDRLDPRDAASHYDLGLAFKQMGLLDDAIIHLQNGLRGGADPLATLEVLGECFVLRGQTSLAARVFDRATRLEGVDEGELVGVLYGLARCQEEMGEREWARATLERLVAVDLSFRDAAERLRRLQSG